MLVHEIYDCYCCSAAQSQWLYNRLPDSCLQVVPVAAGKQIPLEIMPLGDFEPIYGSPLNVQAGELPVLPMSIYGSVAMAHAPDADEGFAAADEFFIYKYDRASSGLAGLSFDEGTFGVFAYIAKV